ncbi:MAG: hypothetical protein JST40_13010 [Armatimonadetes bacterium]|nr:hypothetical protein [Armatimonadota bacterium]
MDRKDFRIGALILILFTLGGCSQLRDLAIGPTIKLECATSQKVELTAQSVQESIISALQLHTKIVPATGGGYYTNINGLSITITSEGLPNGGPEGAQGVIKIEGAGPRVKANQSESRSQLQLILGALTAGSAVAMRDEGGAWGSPPAQGTGPVATNSPEAAEGIVGQFRQQYGGMARNAASELGESPAAAASAPTYYAPPPVPSSRQQEAPPQPAVAVVLPAPAPSVVIPGLERSPGSFRMPDPTAIPRMGLPD